MSNLPDKICIGWHIADVKQVASDLTAEQCREVLQAVERNHDASNGVSWDTLEYWAEEVRKQND